MRKKILSLLSALLLVGITATIVAAGTAQSRIVDVSASNYFGGTAIDDNGSLWKWGGLSDPALPHIVPGMSGVVQTSGTLFYTLALKDDGTVWMMDYYPRPGVSGAFDAIDEPVKIEGISNVTAISCGTDQWLALKDDGTVWAFNMGAMKLEPFMNLENVRQVSQNDDHAIIVRNDGTVMTWGLNDMGQLGTGTHSTMAGVVQDPAGPNSDLTISGLNNVTMAAAGSQFTMALTDDGRVWTWGRNIEGELGDGLSEDIERFRSYPQPVPGLSNVTSIAAGIWSAYALRDDGTVWAWGDNRFCGMLGDGTYESRNKPVQVSGLSGIVKISASRDYVLALDKFGVIWAWGKDETGQLGDGGNREYNCSSTPVKIEFSQSLAGPAIEPAWMVPEYPVKTIPTENPTPTPDIDDDSIRYISVSRDNVIYAFYEHELQAFTPEGALKWSVQIPGRWMCSEEYPVITRTFSEGGYATSTETASPIFAADDGHVYLYVLANLAGDESVTLDRWDSSDPTDKPVMNVEKALVAISPDGGIEWTYSLKENVGVADRASVTVVGDRIYFFHCYTETVLDRSGKVLYSLDNISDPVAIGGDGTLYAFPAEKVDLLTFYDASSGIKADYRAPGSVLKAFDGNGRVLWSKDLGVTAQRPYFEPDARRLFGSLPLSSNSTIYVPLQGGVMALDRSGNILWSDRFDEPAARMLEMMPMDAEGNLYYVVNGPVSSGNARLMIVRPDGSMTTVDEPDFSHASAGFNGVIYEAAPVADSGMSSVTIRAFDVKQGSYRWSHTLPVGETHTVLVDSNNAELFFRSTMAFHPVHQGSGYVWANIIPSGDLVYVDFRAARYESPVIPDETNITYASAIYAIDNQSGIVTQKPLDSYTTAVAANNSTIVYATDGGGGIEIIVLGVAAGLAVIAGALLFAKYLLFGTVVRARSRLETNKNRGSLLKFVFDNPGTTQSEISRHMGMNMGTVRYHLFILELNHKVKVFREGKFIRYFPNSNFYSSEEQLVISMMRREPVRDIIRTLVGRPGQTNSDLSRILGQSESAMSEHMKMLCDRGITIKEKSEDGRILFSVSDEVQATIGHLHERLEQKGIKFGLWCF